MQLWIVFLSNYLEYNDGSVVAMRKLYIYLVVHRIVDKTELHYVCSSRHLAREPDKGDRDRRISCQHHGWQAF